MARVDYRRKTIFKIYLVAILLLVCLFSLSACNNNSGVYDLSGVSNVSEIQSSSSSGLTAFLRNCLIGLNEKIGNFGWTVVAFTVILKLILSPLDFWQKFVARKNAKAMKRMKPQLEAMQAKFGDDKERMQQEQMALYKKEKYSMVGACLPTIITLVVFFIVFAGFRDMVGYQFALDYQSCRDEYNATYDVEMDNRFAELGITKDAATLEQKAEANAIAVDKAQAAVAAFYNSADGKASRGFIYIASADKYLINNLFVQDGWKQAVPDYTAITGQSGFATSKIVGVTADEYNTVMADVLGTGGWGDGGKWNGLLILPILSIVVGFFSQWIMTKAQGTPPPTAGGKDGAASSQASMKMMQYIMPIMTGAFALMYSASFTIYMFVSSFASIAFQLAFNLGGWLVDKSRGEVEVKVKVKAPKTK